MGPTNRHINEITDKDRRSGFARRQAAPPPFSGTERRRDIDRRDAFGKRPETPKRKTVKINGAFITQAIHMLLRKNGRNGSNVKNVMGPDRIRDATHLIDRAHDRINFKAKISIQDGDTFNVYPGTLLNHSQVGMYVETETAPRIHSGVVIHMQNYATDASAPENIRKYYGQVRWSRKLSGMVVFVNYGVGIKFCSNLDEFIKTFGH
jgi:hypothetical protein